MQVATVSETPTHNQSATTSLRAGGTIRQALLSDDAHDGLNFRFIRSQYQGGDAAFESPRHHHSFQQVRFTESGSVNYAPGQDIAQGDLAYFPRGTYYGPQRKDNGAGLLLQFGFNGEHQAGPAWTRYREDALQRLNAHGRFDGGTYVEIDPTTGEEHSKDANQALYEQQYEAHTGQKFVIPPEGYDQPILLHHAAFAYHQASPGIRVKNLGHFFDHPGPNADIRISVVELSDDRAYHLSAERAQIAWSTSAGLRIDERTHPELTCLYSPRDETAHLSAQNPVELYLIEFPRLD